MKTSYRYVVVSDDGRSWLLQGDECYDATTDHNNVLPRLLGDGWEPVRERRLKDSVLVLMAKYEMGEVPEGGSDLPF
jgi:hypothetical protein